ncbi:Trypsin domain containing protein [Trichuris trichiura]|uniref:Trypsin domain containing protein n=1 Tax=Trichuris trichiura TaxID=36087 RepID=A0A077ZLJ3_TRITR|nr:Trypsin domain containing protein [Trichuris trichiura]
MSILHHWAVWLWLLCLYLVQQEVTSQCGDPAKYGGQSIQAYLDDKSDVLPWTVAIRGKFGSFKCLGSIIPENGFNGKHKNSSRLNGFNGKHKNSSRLILTAGSCFRHVLKKRWGTPSSYKVFAGLDRLRLFLNRGQSAEPKGIRIMPYNTVNENIWNGIALVTLKKAFVFNKEVSPVCVKSAYIIPSDKSKCFVSTYHKKRLDEDIVRMVPGSVCKFGHFPELAKTKGLCSTHDRSETEKSLGGPLVCLVDGRAYQYGVYLSELITKEAFSFQKQSLHFYGHVATVLDTSPANVFRFIELGLSQKPSSSKKSSSSSEEKPQHGCKHPPPSGKPQKPGSPTLPPCSKPVKPAQPAPPVQVMYNCSERYVPSLYYAFGFNILRHPPILQLTLYITV